MLVLVAAWIAVWPAVAQAPMGISPTVAQTIPSRGEELSIDGVLEIAFTVPMDTASVEAAFVLSPEAEGSLVWLDDRTLRFTPAIGWMRDQVYHLTLATTARSADGNPLSEPFTAELRTVGYLEVTQTLPADGSSDIETDTAVLILFNRPVVPLTAVSDPGSADLPVPLFFSPSLDGTGTWLNPSTYVFEPSEPLTGGTAYTATVPSGLTDLTGGLLAEDVVFEFSTQRPVVVWTDPARNEELVPIDAEVRVTFNMPVSLASAQDRFALQTTGLFPSLIRGAMSVDGTDLVFVPDEPLAFDREYRVTLDSGITGKAGGLGTAEASTWRFRSVPLPRIIGTTPANGETASPYTSLLIHFNAPIDEKTVMPHVQIEPEPDPADVSTYFRSWDNTFVIRFGAQPSREYVARIRPGIADPYGNTIDQSITVRFETSALDPTAWLHVPGRVGTLSTVAAARLFVGHRNTQRLQITLSQLTVEEYFEAMEDWYRFSPSRDGRIRSWTVDVDAPLNEAAYTPVDLLADGASLEAGIYVVDLEANGVSWNRWQHRHVLVVSPINLTLKTTEDETLVWATDLNTGRPVPGLILWALDGDGDQVDVTVSDSQGVGILAGSEATDWRGLTVVARAPFAMASPDWNSGISRWEFGFGGAGAQDRRAFIDTDRPIYRPGQSVSFRGILRSEDDAAYALPQHEAVDVTVWDAVWNVVYEERLLLDAFGAFSGSLDLEESGSLGTYRIETRVGGDAFSTTFQVAAYSAPEFSISVTPEIDEIPRGQEIDAVIHAGYFFGAPVADLEVEWRVIGEDFTFTAPQFGNFTFSDVDDPWICWGCWWWTPPSAVVPLLEGSGTTDASGNLVIQLPGGLASQAAQGEDPVSGPRVLILEATATGRDGQTLSGRGRILVHPADHYVGLASARAIGRAGEPMTIDAVTVDWSGARAADRRITYTVYRREWINEFVEDEAGGGEWTWTTQDILITSGETRTDAVAEAAISFVPPEGGSYKIIAESLDRAERETRTSLFVWVTGPETVAWRRSNDDRITLISDKTNYTPGETAEILIPSPYPGPQWALITIERGGILSREVVELPTNSTVYRVPITEAHIPNVYVSVVLVQGHEAALAAAAGGPAAAGTKLGYVSLAVDVQPKTLQIEILPDSAVSLPGEAMRVALRVTDADGQPVETSLAFDAVDQAVLTLRPRTPDAIVNAFYAPRGLGVNTASGLAISLERLVLEQLEDAGLGDDELFGVDRDEATAGAVMPLSAVMEDTVERAAEPKAANGSLPEGLEVREEFADTAAWFPSVVTDADGFAEIVIDLPDNLTTWALRAVGVTRGTLVGEGTGDLLVTKPLLIRPVTPRFFVVGDRVRLAALVSNQTDTELDVEVTIAQSGMTVHAPETQTITLAANSEREVVWPVTVDDVRAVDVVFAAVSGDLSDAARPRLTTGPDGTIPVYRYTAPETVGTAGILAEAGSRTEGIVLPANADPLRSEVILRLDASLAAAMQDGLSYLEHFEYECTEQVVSRFLPNALTARALSLLGIEDEALAAKLETLVPQGLEKLYQRQNADGGWGWWETDRSSPYLTAYAAYAMLRVQEIGYPVRETVIASALDHLERSLVTIDSMSASWEANRQAWLLYVLALGGREGEVRNDIERLFEARERLSHYARAYLAMALASDRPGDSRIDTLLSDLYNAAILTATGVHWEEPDYDWWAMNTDTRSTAIILEALTHLDSANPLVANVVRWLMVARRNGIWETTQETAWALVALTDWMVSTGELDAAYDYVVLLNGRQLAEGSVTAEAVRTSQRLTIEGTDLTSGGLDLLTLSRSAGDGRLYYSAHLSVHLPVEDVEPLGRGIFVYREYLTEDGQLLDGGEVHEAAVGESIRVRLTIIAPHDLYYVVVEDPIPAGCEGIDTSLATTSLLDPTPGISRETDSAWGWYYRWWWQWTTRTEMRDEKVVLFADSLPAGTYTYEYGLRAVQPGEYRVLPASAHEFYFPEVFGRSEGRLFTVLSPE